MNLDELNKEIQNTSLIRTLADKEANKIIALVKEYVDWAFYQVFILLHNIHNKNFILKNNYLAQKVSVILKKFVVNNYLIVF